MHLFLTSSPCDDNVPQGVTLPCILDASNGFVDRLARCHKPDSRMVIVAASPHNFALNDEMLGTFHNAFNYHHLTLSETVMLDARSERDAARLIALSDVVMLAGGLGIDRIEVIFVPEQYLKRRSMFIAFFDAALFYHTISEENQQRIVIKRNDIFNQLSKTLLHVFRKLCFLNWRKVVIILRTPSHGKHQKIKLIVFF